MRSVALEEDGVGLEDAEMAFAVSEWACDSDEVGAQFLLELLDGLVGRLAIDDGERLVWHERQDGLAGDYGRHFCYREEEEPCAMVIVLFPVGMNACGELSAKVC